MMSIIKIYTGCAGVSREEGSKAQPARAILGRFSYQNLYNYMNDVQSHHKARGLLHTVSN